MNQVRSARGRYAWITVPASFGRQLQGAPVDHELDRFDVRVGGRIVDATHDGGVILDIDASEDSAGQVMPFAARPGVTPIPSERIKRIDLVAHLSDGDPYAPFFYRIGDEVAVIRVPGIPDPESHGVIIDGTCEYQLGSGSGWYKEPTYKVKRADGTTFHAREMELAKREPAFANVREATRIIRDWIRPANTKGHS